MFRYSLPYRLWTILRAADPHSLYHRLRISLGHFHRSSLFHRAELHYRMKPSATFQAPILRGLICFFRHAGVRFKQALFSAEKMLQDSKICRLVASIWHASRQKPVSTFLSGLIMLALGINIALLLRGAFHLRYLLLLATLFAARFLIHFFRIYVRYSLAHRIFSKLYREM